MSSDRLHLELWIGQKRTEKTIMVNFNWAWVKKLTLLCRFLFCGELFYFKFLLYYIFLTGKSMKVRIIKMGPQGMTKTITQSPLGCSSNMCGKSLSEQDQHWMKTTVWRGHTSLMHMRWQTSTPDWLDRFLFVKRYTMIQQCGKWHLIRVLNWSFNFDFLCVKLCRKKAYFPYF